MGGSSNSSSHGLDLSITSIFNGTGSAQNLQGVATKAFVLNLAVSLSLFAFELIAFFLLKSSAIGRRI